MNRAWRTVKSQTTEFFTSSRALCYGTTAGESQYILLPLMCSAVAFGQCDELFEAGVVLLVRPYESDRPGHAKV
jgi:hypothetical protein